MKDISLLRILDAVTAGKGARIRIVSGLLLSILLLAGLTVNSQVGVHTDFPDASSAMEIYATDKGLLIPRVSLSSDLNSPSPVSSPANGLLVFNNGSNQPQGFYYWNGSQWVAVGSGGGGGGDYWTLTGNAGTSPASNYVGTSDNQHFVVRSNGSERMRFETDGQILIGRTTPFYSSDFVTINANSSQDYALSLYSPYVGAYASTTYSGFFAEDGRYGLVAYANANNGFGVFAKNTNTSGHGLIAVGANSPNSSLSTRIVGVNASGPNGVFSIAHLSSGTGVLGVGNSLDSASALSGGSGGAFTGFNGLYGMGVATDGIGVVGVGNNSPNYFLPSTGCGGTFTGYHGLYGYGTASSGYGITALGSNANTYFTMANGIGGNLAGYHGMIAWGQNSTAGTGVIGAGNNQSYSVLTVGSGGAFVGFNVGAYGYATSTSGDRYGGYFAAAGNINPSGVGYAYVGGRYNGTQCKILGTGSVSTIVKDTQGKLIALTCPEAPEALFQDYGVGQLINGRAHISIDPDLAINITVNENHPLKVFITPEGDCNGVYVTNKTAEGFDVVELQGGESNIPFSWQIVATRANEYAVAEDGSQVLVSDYSRRFPPAPGPMSANDARDVITETVNYDRTESTPVTEAEDVRPQRNE